MSPNCRRGHTISILIPAFNEAERIAATIAAARRIRLPQSVEIIVVDDGSGDGTALAAEMAGADVVLRQRNAGKGAALIAASRRATGEILVLLDADLGTTASEAAELIEPVVSGAADMSIAMFPVQPGRGGGLGMVVRLARWGIRWLTGRTMSAPLSGQRALTRETLDACGGFAQGWGVEIALTVRALWLGLRVMEAPTEMDHRVSGRSMRDAIHRAAQFRAILATLAGLWWSRASNARRRPRPIARSG